MRLSSRSMEKPSDLRSSVSRLLSAARDLRLARCQSERLGTPPVPTREAQAAPRWSDRAVPCQATEGLGPRGRSTACLSGWPRTRRHRRSTWPTSKSEYIGGASPVAPHRVAWGVPRLEYRTTSSTGAARRPRLDRQVSKIAVRPGLLGERAAATSIACTPWPTNSPVARKPYLVCGVQGRETMSDRKPASVMDPGGLGIFGK